MSFRGALTPPAPRAEGGQGPLADRILRRNLLALGADLGLFLVGLSFASQATILPAFAVHLGAPNVVIGAIPAVMTVGWFLPSLFAAGYTEALPRKLPFVLRCTVWERLPFLFLALAAFFLAEPAPAFTLGLLLTMLLVITGVGGALMPAWMDIVGRAIPTTLRGRFFAVASILGSAGGFAGSFATTHVLSVFPAPASYGLCFLIAAFFMGCSYAALACAREAVAAPRPPAVPLKAYLTRIPGLLRRNRNLAWFLIARAFSVLGVMGSGFYTVYALQAHGAPTSQVGVFTAILLAGQTVGNLVFGWIADRAGHRLVLMAGVAAATVANLVAMAAPSAEVFGAVFGFAGVYVAAIHVSGLAVLLEFAPAEDEQPTYVGLGNTSLGPIMCAAPLAAGLMVDALGFELVFAAAAAFGATALGLLIGRVRDPRHVRALAA
ncbi:MAG: MFS transporter [Candidatus Rokubacteria bacterium]|nr:MFS transporter [Candidatus Rokubacteria bacterium]